jgi:hypothetical protein
LKTFLALVAATSLFFGSCGMVYTGYKDYNLSYYTDNQINQVAEKVIKSFPVKGLDDVDIVVADQDDFNAFASQPDGPSSAKIVIFSGALKFLKNEDELAFLIGHEYSHILLGHTRINGVYEESTQSAETYADLMGQQLMRIAGYDPGYASDTWIRFDDKYATTGGTHPLNQLRASRLKTPKFLCNEIYEVAYSIGKWEYNSYQYLKEYGFDYLFHPTQSHTVKDLSEQLTQIQEVLDQSGR